MPQQDAQGLKGKEGKKGSQPQGQRL